MSADPQQVQKIFTTAVEIADLKKRHEFLAAECAGNSELMRRVLELLAAFDQPKRFLDQPTLVPAKLEDSDSGGQHPGSIVAGKYKLLEAIGEGGMGTVWVAEQTKPVRRKVALKLVKPGMDSRQVLARFDAERQALALMDHPNIAKVFDGGVTDQGRPFFAMEYVKGMPLTEYCDQVRLSLEERLRLFVPICQAVQHAHQKGIIHRDLKPSNVLICLYDGKPVPKVIDFGLAKAMHQPLTEQTLHTGHGLMLGTPLYMSPEQAEHNNLDVDTRTDVYSLGVMLYELLTGTTPLEKAQFKEAAFGEILRLIKEVEPPKPSTRISTNAQRASIAAQRSLDPEQLGRSIRGDLDWIIMKALDKERDRRYETANGLARDIERFLSHEAVEACPPSTSYRLKKQFQKHRAAISTAAAFLLLICAGAVISTWQAYRATTAEKAALKAEAAAREQRDKALENERQALAARTAESTARIAEEQARAAESQQRSLAESQKAEAEKQRDEAQRLQHEAVARSAELEQLSEEQRRAIYASDMNLVRLEALRGNLPRMREILYAQLPIDRPDLRGFEWYYWYRYLTQAKVLRHFDNFRGEKDSSQPVMLPGAKVAAVPKGTTTTLVDLADGDVLQTVPLEVGTLIDRARFAAGGRSVFGATWSMSAFGGSVQLIETGAVPFQGSLRPEGFVVYDPASAPRKWQYPDDTFSHISYLDISEDGRFVGVLGNDVTHTHDEPACRLRVWNFETQELILDHLENRRLNRFAFNQDGSRLAAFCCHGPLSYSNDFRDVVVALEVASGKVLGVARHNDDIDTANWLPDNQRLILTTLGFSGHLQKELLSWDMASEQPRLLSTELMPKYAVVVTSPDGRMLAVSSPNTSSIRLIDSSTGSLVRTLHNEASNIESMNFSEDSTKLIAFCASGDVVEWSVASDDDRFALRSQPLPSAPSEEFVRWAFSPEQDRLAYGIRGAFLSVRSAEGKELFRRDQGIQSQVAESPLLQFHPTGELLAVAVQKEAASTVAIDLIDLRESKVRWSVPFADTHVFNVRMDFTGDGKTLVITSDTRIQQIDVEAGESTELPRNPDQGPFLTLDLLPAKDGSTVLAAGYALNKSLADATGPKLSMEIRDTLSGKQLYVVQDTRVQGAMEGRIPTNALAAGDNGKRIVRARKGLVEVWDMPRQQMQFRLSGDDFLFCPDGASLIVMTHAAGETSPVSSISQKRRHPIESLQFVALENGRRMSELSFSGDPADDLRISSDGSRLLSLHGQRPDADRSRPAYARLWDSNSGREILDLPISPDCQFHWDLDMSPDGNMLTGAVLSRLRGNTTGGRSLLFDATRLSPEADAMLVASNWVKTLEVLTPVPQQVVNIIKSNDGAVPLVRETALSLAQRIPFDEEKISSRCLEVVERGDQDAEMYQRALSWVQALQDSEPDSLRAAALISAALFRLGRTEQSLKTIESIDGRFQKGDLAGFRWERMRRAVEILCLDQRETDPITVHRRAIQLSDLVHDQHPANTAIEWLNLERLALGTQGVAFRSQQLTARYRAPLGDAGPGVGRQKTLGASADRMKEDFTAYDANRDNVLLENEVGAKFWDKYRHFDRDGVFGLSLIEWTAARVFQTAFSAADRSRITGSNPSEFASIDKNRDGRVTPNETGARWQTFGKWDLDKNDELSIDEYSKFEGSNLFVRELHFQLIAGTLTPQTQLLTLNLALEERPDEMNFLDTRAWMLATTPEDSLRNGDQAVKDAIRACEVCEYRLPYCLDTLAAAYAEQGDFGKAVEYSEKACSMVGDLNSATQHMKQRLELFRQKKPYREIASSPTAARTDAASEAKPLISAAQLKDSPRVAGGEPCWSSDGKRLIYSLTAFAPEVSYFESLDLATGETKILCRGGKRPSCSPIDGTLAFERTSQIGTELWLADADGGNERKLADGYLPNWTQDGKLCYYPPSGDNPQIVCVSIDRPNEFLWSRPAGFSQDSNLAVSADGTQIAWSSFGKWNIFNLQETAPLPQRVPNELDRGRSHWSSDGKLIAYDVAIERKRAVWVAEAKTGKTRLLADIAAIPHWSPDGKTLALGLLSSNEILLVDVSTLKDAFVHE